MGRAAAVASPAHRSRGKGGRRGLAGAARDPTASRAPQGSERYHVGGAQPPPLRDGVGRHGGSASDSRPEFSAWRWHVDSDRRVRRSGQRRQQRGLGQLCRWATPRWPCWPDMAFSSLADRLAQSISVRSRSSSVANERGTPAPLGAMASRDCRSPLPTTWRRATARGLSASGRRPSELSWRPIPTCSGTNRPDPDRRPFRPAPAPSPRLGPRWPWRLRPSPRGAAPGAARPGQPDR